MTYPSGLYALADMFVFAISNNLQKLQIVVKIGSLQATMEAIFSNFVENLSDAYR